MKLKGKITKEMFEALPETLREYYEVSKDDSNSYNLVVEGLVSSSRLDEFRTNNINLEKEKEKILKQFEGVDVEEYKRLKDEQQKMKDKKLLDEGKVEELINQRTERMRVDSDNQIKKLSEALEKERKEHEVTKGHLASVLIDGKITETVSSIGTVRSGAFDDVLARGRKVWKLQDGKPVPLDSDGNLIYGKDGKEVMSFKEWGEELLVKAPFLFDQPSGSGSPGGENRNPAANRGANDLKTITNPVERLKALHRRSA